MFAEKIRNKIFYDKSTTIIILFLMVISISGGFIISTYENSLILIYGLFGIFFLLFLIIYPVWSLPIIISIWGIFHEFLENEVIAGLNIFGLEINYSRATGLLIIIGILISFIINKRVFSFMNDNIIRIYILFEVWVFIISVFLSPLNEGLSFLIRFSSGFIILLAFYSYINTLRKLIIVSWIMVSFGCINALYTIIKYLAGTSNSFGFINNLGLNSVSISYFEGISRSSGIGGAFVSSGILMVIIGFSLVLLDNVKKKNMRYLLYFSIVVLFLGIISTITRTTIFGSIFLIILWSFLKNHGFTKKTIITIILLGLLFVISVQLFNSSSIINRLSDISGSMGLGWERIGNGRLGIWASILKLLWNLSPIKWIIGGGIGFSYSASMLVWGRADPAHNQYIWLLAETGLVGIIIYLAFIFSSFSRFINYIRSMYEQNVTKLNGLIALFISIYLIFAMLWDFSHNAVFSWFFLPAVGISLRLSIITPDSTKRNVKENINDL